MSNSHQHGGGPATSRPTAPEPSLAERARTLLHVGRIGTLATLSRKHPGWPFGSLMPYALDPRGRPIFLVSSMAMHTQNLHGDPRASLFVTQSGVTGDPLGAARVTVMGQSGPAGPEARALYLALHSNAQYWIDFDDFSLIHLDVHDVYYVGGFGVMGWIGAEEYVQASPDPLADQAPGIIQHMNADHGDALLRITRNFAGLEADEASITSVDRLGFEVRLKTGDRVHGTRITFPAEVKNADESRRMFIEMTRGRAPKD